jgi:nucleotide-binding universal stress UspA family protein
MKKRILVPCDFSFTSKQAFSFALQVAQRIDAEIHVLKAIDFPFSYESAYASGHYFHEAELLKTLQDDARQSFDAMTKEVGRSGAIHFSALQGPVTNIIQTYIENEKIDMVIMGTNGATGIKEYFVGSNTEKVVRFSPVPVIAVRHAVNLSSLTDIVVPTDAEEVYPSFVKELKLLQAMSFATLHFLLVSTDYPLLNSNQMMNKLDAYTKKCGFENFTINLQREDGKEKGIVEFAKEINADMIAMATHGRRGIGHLFAGSLAEDIVNHVNCPVWTYSIRSEQAIEGTEIVAEKSKVSPR